MCGLMIAFWSKYKSNNCEGRPHALLQYTHTFMFANILIASIRKTRNLQLIDTRNQNPSYGIRCTYMYVYKFVSLSLNTLLRGDKGSSLPFECRDPLYLAVSVTDGLHTRIESALHLCQWQSILKDNQPSLLVQVHLRLEVNVANPTSLSCLLARISRGTPSRSG